MLDRRLWDNLEAHGVTEAHLELLLRTLELQKNGSVAWHFVHGTLTQCDLRVTFPSRRAEVTRVCAALLDGASVLR